MEYQKSAGVVVYYFDEKPYFLLLKYPSYWGFSKGLVEEGESEKQAALRELEEEAGIKAEILPGFKERQEWFFKFKGKLIKKEAVFFVAKTSKKEAKKTKLSFEHEGFDWLTEEEAEKKLKIKANRELLKKASKFINEYEKQKRLF